MSATRPRFDLHDGARFAALAWALGIGTYLGLVLARDLSDPERLARRDFYCFWRAGELALGGGTGYEQVDRTFANPPFARPLVEGLALLSPSGAFFLIDALSLVGAVVAALAVSALPRVDARFHVTGVALVATTPSFVSALHLGQWTGLYLALSGLALHALAVRRDVLGGVVVAALLVKPPLALALFVVGAALRPRVFVLAWTVTALVLVGSSLPLGLAPWYAWRTSLDALIERHEATVDSWRKQFTVYAFVRTMLSWVGGPRALARAVAIALAAAFGAAFLTRLRAARAIAQADDARGLELRLRAGSIAILATVALNLYLFYYDAALLALPGLLLFTHRPAWRSVGRWRAAVALAALVWFGQLLPMLWRGGPSPVGPLVLGWAVLELLELRALVSLHASAPAPPE